MKILQSVQAKYELLGINLEQSTHRFPHNPKIFCGFLLFGLTTASFVVYLIQVADTLIECIECITTTSAALIIAVCLGAIVFKMSKLFENISILENVIEIGMLKTILQIISSKECHIFQDPNIQNRTRSFMKQFKNQTNGVKLYFLWQWKYHYHVLWYQYALAASFFISAPILTLIRLFYRSRCGKKSSEKFNFTIPKKIIFDADFWRFPFDTKHKIGYVLGVSIE